jgi:cation diffusion facilitator CzcD-associated flavoprotein CzcO
MAAAQADLDVLIIGAGISGLSAAWHLKRQCPDQRFLILESRDALGGTWDLFRYPGIRSDSDMYTLGFRFKPWRAERSIAAGSQIRSYLQEMADENDLNAAIRFGLRVRSADWRSGERRWRVQAVREHADDAGLRDAVVEFSCRFLFVCSGYYRYDAGYQPSFEGLEVFQGRQVHAQHWPEDLDCKGKRVVVIGSGATAVTLVPALARSGAHVVQLQRTPSYLLALPGRDALALALRRLLPERAAYALTRAKNVLVGAALFKACRRWPAAMRRLLVGGVRKALRPGLDAAPHFDPPYRPWEQRLCLVPDADYFRALNAGQAEVVTDTIDRFTAHGIRLRGGRELAADIVVFATGLQLQVLGGAQLSLDGMPVASGELINYKGVMYCGIPNFAATFGYTNASWTLKADLTSQYVCRLLRTMGARGAGTATPRYPPPGQALQPMVDLSSGYFQRALHLLPRQGTQRPWKLSQSYLADVWQLRYRAVDDGVLAFDQAVAFRPASESQAAQAPRAGTVTAV